MKKPLTILLLAGNFFLSPGVAAQTTTTEQQLEALSESDENQLENDQYLQELRYFRLHPININTASAEDLQTFKFLSELQVQHLLRYREAFGKFLSLYELQAVPQWDLVTLRRIAPFITISDDINLKGFKDRFRKGEHSLLLRETRVLETQKGYSGSVANGYLGSPDHVLFRYRYQYKNELRYGITGDKDAGERFGKGAQPGGFDFYSFHLFAGRLGSIKALALGDFTVNMGQGLIQWQSLAFKKGGDATAIKRQGAFLQPYSSAGEYNFNRGAGITFQRKRVEASIFASYKGLNANRTGDTLRQDEDISGFLTSGYNRTASEIADKQSVKQTSFGGNLRYHYKTLQIGMNAAQYWFSLPLQLKEESYNKYEVTGKQWAAYSLDYSYTYRNLHLFGELAQDQKGSQALVSGLIGSLDPKVDVALLYRRIDASYRSLYGNAFTENTLPENENGCYLGLTIRPDPFWKIDVYGDFFRFPWLKYRVDAPSYGHDYLFQATYQPSRQFEMYVRYKTEKKSLNGSPDSTTHPVLQIPRQNWRLHFACALSSQVTLKA
ncbi:MAG: hypothetical protein JWP88_208, partial [Flaviaesturariibacter sp.]|nr:hypothetical protein [Flaviaesturariibacter sp.]